MILANCTNWLAFSSVFYFISCRLTPSALPDHFGDTDSDTESLPFDDFIPSAHAQSKPALKHPAHVSQPSDSLSVEPGSRFSAPVEPSAPPEPGFSLEMFTGAASRFATGEMIGDVRL